MVNPNDIRVLFEQALRKHQAGHFGGAEKLYRRILDKQPSHRDSLHLLGAIRLSENKPRNAIVLIEKALALGPDVAAICFNLARAYEDNDEAERALQLYERARKLDKRDPDIDFGIGTALSSLKRFKEAVAAFDRALALDPTHEKSQNNKGIALKNLDQFDDALNSYMAAISINPSYIDAHLNRAALLATRNRLDEALESYNNILSVDPRHAVALFKSGKIHSIQENSYEAISRFSRALAIKPKNIECLIDFLTEKSKIADWLEFDKYMDLLRRGLKETSDSIPQLNVGRLFDSAEIMLQAAKSFGGEGWTQDLFIESIQHTADRRIKVGYFSSDLHAMHPVFQAIQGLLRHHDRALFEIHYFLLPVPTLQSRPPVLQDMGDFVHELPDIPDAQLLKIIRNEKLDIAIDLNGYTRYNRRELFIARVAPIQINYLGFPGSMGSIDSDYIVADKTIIPESHFVYFSEKIVWMPNSFFPVDNARPVKSETPTRTASGLPEKGFVFGYFGLLDRILPSVFDSWVSILKAVDDSVLWLKVPAGIARENLIREAEERGLSADRIVFAERVDSNADHLARLALIDLCLDTYPYNAHMTALDCLYAGVPILTLQGETFAARVASSLLYACDLPELCCVDRETYERRARELASSPEKLAMIKSKVQHARQTSALFDSERYARDFEKALIEMVKRKRGGQPAQHFAVT
jgi:protein O-GlcNAc transferase